MQLYDNIFVRKSTRKFQAAPLPSRQLTQIMEFAQAAKPLFPEIGTHMELAGPDGVKGMVSAKAPHYLLIYSEQKEGYLANAGFLLQQADLYLCSLGLGSCWLGMAKTSAPAKNDMEYVIMLAFGTAQESPHRASLSSFKRKQLPEIASGRDERLEAARLAPSATNSQPWYFACEKDGVYVYRRKLGALKAAIYGSMNQIDMGIALCHFWLACEKQNRTFSFTAKTENPPAVDGYLCIGKVQ